MTKTECREADRIPREMGVLEQMKSYEAIRKLLVLRPTYYNPRRQELRGYVYERYGDVALVLHLLIHAEERKPGMVKVPRQTADDWKVSRKHLMGEAIQNTRELAPPLVVPGAFEDEFRLTTRKKREGAIAFFYPGMKEELAALAGGSFYVAFLNTDEAAIYPAGSILPIRILRRLKKISSAGEAERLSRKVFFYDVEKKTFRAVEF